MFRGRRSLGINRRQQEIRRYLANSPQAIQFIDLLIEKYGDSFLWPSRGGIWGFLVSPTLFYDGVPSNINFIMSEFTIVTEAGLNVGGTEYPFVAVFPQSGTNLVFNNEIIPYGECRGYLKANAMTLLSDDILKCKLLVSVLPMNAIEGDLVVYVVTLSSNASISSCFLGTELLTIDTVIGNVVTFNPIAMFTGSYHLAFNDAFSQSYDIPNVIVSAWSISNVTPLVSYSDATTTYNVSLNASTTIESSFLVYDGPWELISLVAAYPLVHTSSFSLNPITIKPGHWHFFVRDSKLISHEYSSLVITKARIVDATPSTAKTGDSISFDLTLSSTLQTIGSAKMKYLTNEVTLPNPVVVGTHVTFDAISFTVVGTYDFYLYDAWGEQLDLNVAKQCVVTSTTTYPDIKFLNGNLTYTWGYSLGHDGMMVSSFTSVPLPFPYSCSFYWNNFTGSISAPAGLILTTTNFLGTTEVNTVVLGGTILVPKNINRNGIVIAGGKIGEYIGLNDVTYVTNCISLLPLTSATMTIEQTSPGIITIGSGASHSTIDLSSTVLGGTTTIWLGFYTFFYTAPGGFTANMCSRPY